METEPVEMPSGRFEGREAFIQIVRDSFSCAAQQGWQQIVVSDASFEDWPLHERAVVESLQQWSATGRRFVMLAGRYDALLRNQARFVTWRQRWDHIIDCRICRNLDQADFPSLIWSPVWALRRLDLIRSTGVCGATADRRQQVRENLDELLAASTPGFPSSTLGL